MVNIDEKRLQHAFLEEVTELLESLNEKLLALEQSPEDPEIINEIFRLTHSIKSESSLIGFMKISSVAHKMEDIFEKVRNNELLVDREITDSLFSGYDKIMEMITAVQQGKDESKFDVTEVVNKLLKILNESPDEKQKKGTATEEKEELLNTAVLDVNKIEIAFNDFEKGQIEDSLEKGEKFYKTIYYLSKDCDMRYPRAYLVYNNLTAIGTVVKTIPDILLEADDVKFSQVELYLLSAASNEDIKKCAEVDQVDKIEIGPIDMNILKNMGLDLSNLPEFTDILISEDQVSEAEAIEKEWAKQLEDQKEADKKASEAADTEGSPEVDTIQKTVKRQTIRVDTDRLDNMMNLVGELIINHSRYTQIKSSITENTSPIEIRSEIEDATNDLERISDQMQSGMMQVRMVPIGNVFSRFPRMVRDLANSLNKKVNLLIYGEGTEIDRAIIELITEPLTHLIRNSIDHGIETPEQRLKKGKPDEGIIMLKAYQQGSNIYIEVNDDGKGISIERIKETGIEKELITAQQASSMDKDEVLSLIFEPGFSTKEEITGVSGRGVGMDVVKKQIEKLRGTINIETEPGKGTDITIILPLTLTIVEALLVNVGKSIFAIPINVVEETMLINKKIDIKDFDDYKIYNLRSETLAIMSLAELTQLEEENKGDDVFMVVVSYEKTKIGLLVDELIGDQDIFIKALDPSLKSIEGIAGATVLGDGQIALIIDVSTLVRSRIKEINKLMTEAYDFFEKDESSFNKVYDELNKESEKKVKEDAEKENIEDKIEDNLNEIPQEQKIEEEKPEMEKIDVEVIDEDKLSIQESDLEIEDLEEIPDLDKIESKLVDEESFKNADDISDEEQDELDEIESSLKELEETLKDIRKTK